MSPELERLLNALWEVRNCDPRDRAKWDATAERLIQDALHRTPGVNPNSCWKHSNRAFWNCAMPGKGILQSRPKHEPFFFRKSGPSNNQACGFREQSQPPKYNRPVQRKAVRREIVRFGVS